MTAILNLKFELKRFRRRAFVVGLVVVVAFCVLASRLVYLQIVRHDEFKSQAETNRTAILPIVPNRGMIVDRNGIVLATNYSAYTLEITPSKVDNVDATINALAEIVSIDVRDRRRFKRLQEESKNFESLPIRTKLSDEEVARFAAQRYRYPGVDIKARLFRNYPHGDVASHVLGYIGRINQNEKERLEESDQEGNYRGTEYIGKLGVEQSFEAQLHGTTGVDWVETSAGGRAVRKLGNWPPVMGHTVKLTIDIKLQKLAEDLFGERRGALVAINPENGEVLALVSKPTFDPNLFVEGIDVENWQLLNESLDKPLLNRALRGTYPPGSTFKPFMALAGLELGKRTPGSVTNDPGFWMLGEHRFRSHDTYGLGPVDMYKSIVKSSNVYYYALAYELGVDAMHDFMKPLGFGQITGIDIRGETRGLLPSRDWKQQAYRTAAQKTWYAGETVSLGIGQGYNAFTMLQLAHATATLSNGGIKYPPRLVMATQEALSDQPETPVALRTPPENLGYQPKNIEAVRNALVGVTQEGTSARVFAGAGYLSGGKTGTAQAVTIGQKDKYDSKRLEEHQRDHALYMAFAPADKPKIALAVIVENAGFGAEHAAPIARRVFDYWLMNQYPSEEDLAAVKVGKAAAPIGTPRLASAIDWPPGSVPELALPPDPAASAPSATGTVSAASSATAASAPRPGPLKPDMKPARPAAPAASAETRRNPSSESAR